MELKLAVTECFALLRLIAGHQAAMSERAMNARQLSGQQPRQFGARKQRLDAAIWPLFGKERFAQFEQFRKEFTGGRGF